MPLGVLQPLPGLGDMIWFLPALRALAAAAPDGKILLFTKGSSQAKKLLAHEDWIADIVYLPTARGLLSAPKHLFQLVACLRAHPVEALYILHKSARYAWAARLARVPKIFAYTRRFARTPGNGGDKGIAFVESLGLPIPDRRSRLTPPPQAVAALRARFADRPEPWFVVAPGATADSRRWPAARFAACADFMAARLGGTVFITDSPDNKALVEETYAVCRHADRIVPCADLSLAEFMGLLASSQGLLGNDSGAANLAAALGRPAFTLCGVTKPARHSPNLIILEPDLPEEPTQTGMARLSIEAVRAELSSAFPAG